MKKIYLFLLTFSFVATTFAQSPIVTIDRDNTTEPTATGTTANISAIGLTRGIGINHRNGTDFSSRDWDGASQGDAVTNNDYMEWSVSSNVNYDTELTKIDIRLRRNANGPANWQLFYSLDGFATAGTAINGIETLTENTNVITNINGLSINSGDAGTITFRLYAWNAAANNGWLRVRRRAGWSDFGIALPGIRLTGNVTNLNPAISSESNIIAAPSFTPNTDINYLNYTTASGLTVGNAIKIGELTIQDGGDDLTDTDLLPTILTDLDFSVSGNTNIAALALFDGVVNVSEITTVDANVSFSGLNLIAPDDSSKTFDVYASFNTSVTDNEQIQLTVNAATPNGTLGSTFAASNAGGAQTSIAGDDNRIEVTRSMLVFSQQPSDVNLYEVMSPSVRVQGIDVNSNLDLDYNGVILIGSAIPLDGSSTNNTSAVAGEAVFDNLIFSGEGTDVLTATPLDAGITASGPSTSFTVSGPLLTIAIQDFDSSSPTWNYTNDIPFFDNGWGTGGFYGIIDSAGGNATPLDHGNFNNNILGENDLNQGGGSPNGTNQWATITFDAVDISGFTDIKVQFDWQVVGYVNNSDDAQYRLILDGVNQPRQFLHNGNGPENDASGTISLNIDDAVNTIALEIRVRNNGINGYSGFDNFRVASTFNGLVYTNSVWTPGPPTGSTGALNALVIDGTYTVGSNINLNDLFVNTGAQVSVIEGQSLTLNGNLANLGNVELNSISSSYSSLIVDGSILNDVIYNRYVNIVSGGNDLIAAPVTGQTFADFAGNNPNLFANPAEPTEKLFGPFDKTTDTYLTWNTAVPTEANAILAPAIGYRAASSDGATLSFEGAVNTNNVNIGIVNSGPTNPEWNLIGNPYPSYIKLADFLAANNFEFAPPSAGVYGFDGDPSDGWNIWNQAYSDLNPNAIITPGQGFLVASAVGGGTISFTPSMRSNGSSDDFIPGAANNDNMSIAHFKLSITNASEKSYATDFYITDKASKGLDPGYDAGVFSGNAPDYAVYSHLVKENTGRDMSVQSIAFEDLANEVVIPLGINVSQGEQVTVKIGAATMPRDVKVYLEDSEANSFTLLNSSAYTFTANNTISETGRFFLRLTRDVLSLGKTEMDKLQIFTTSAPKALFINGQLHGKSKMSLYDIQGRLVKETSLNASLSSHKIDLNSIKTGVYIVKVSNPSNSKTQKVIIR